MVNGYLTRKQLYRMNLLTSFGFSSFGEMYPELPIPKIRHNNIESDQLDFNKNTITYNEKIDSGVTEEKNYDDTLDEISNELITDKNENIENKKNKSCMKKKSCSSPTSVINIEKKKITFSNIVSVILIPERFEYFLTKLDNMLWYKNDEINLFIHREQERILMEKNFGGKKF